MVKELVQLWLALRLVPRLAVKRKLAMVQAHGLPQIFQLSQAQLAAMGLNEAQVNAIIRPDWRVIDQIISQSQQAGSEIIYYGHAHYSKLVAELYDPPLVLWLKGDASLLNQPQIAMVGSRAASYAGREFARQLASELSHGLVITSGLALGIDAACHQGALAASGKTIAVVGTGIDIVYPSRHKQLARSIVEKGGLIVSEFLPTTSAKPGHFPRRNRIISGLSLGTVVVEAEIKSGSLVTARCALEQDREVFAVPGSPLNPMAMGCNELIKQGAKLINSAADIMEELNFFSIPNSTVREEEKVEKIDKQGLLNDSLLASVGYEITPVDMVVSRSKLPTDEVLTRLTMLELRGLVSAVPGGYLRLHRG